MAPSSRPEAVGGRVAGWSAAPRASRRAPHALGHVQAVGVGPSGTTTASGQRGRPELDDFAEGWNDGASAERRTSRNLTFGEERFEAPLPPVRAAFSPILSREANHLGLTHPFSLRNLLEMGGCGRVGTPPPSKNGTNPRPHRANFPHARVRRGE